MCTRKLRQNRRPDRLRREPIVHVIVADRPELLIAKIEEISAQLDRRTGLTWSLHIGTTADGQPIAALVPSKGAPA